MGNKEDAWLEGIGVTWFKTSDDGEPLDDASAVLVAQRGDNDGDSGTALTSGGGAAPGGGGGSSPQDIADRITTKIKADGDLRFDLAMLAGKDMRTLLDVMVSLKKAGKLEDFADHVTSENTRVGVAILTIRPDLDAQWQGMVAKLNAADREAILERVPDDAKASIGSGGNSGPATATKKDDDDDDAPEASVTVDPLKREVETQVEIKLSYKEASGIKRQIPVKISLHFDGKNFKGLEGELTVLTKKLKSQMAWGTITDVTVSVSFSAELTLDKDAANRVMPQFAAKLKAALSAELKIPGTAIKIPIEVSLSAGPDGKPEGSINITVFTF